MIVDTNALSDIFKKRKGIGPYLLQADALYLPVIVLGEYLFGIKGSKKRIELLKMLEGFLQTLTVLGIDKTTAKKYSDIRWELKSAGTPIPENDIWIAALARQHRIEVLSNDSHFDRVPGIVRIGWQIDYTASR